jgi:hypothetical protein
MPGQLREVIYWRSAIELHPLVRFDVALVLKRVQYISSLLCCQESTLKVKYHYPSSTLQVNCKTNTRYSNQSRTHTASWLRQVLLALPENNAIL